MSDTNKKTNKKRPTQALAEGYTINKKYKIQDLISANETILTYHVKDLSTEREFELREYFPHDMVNRESDGKVSLRNPDYKTVYTQGMTVFENEAKVIRALGREANFITAYDIIRANDTLYLVADYFDGKDIVSNVISTNKAYTHLQAGEMLRKISTTIKALHTNGLMHRRLAPDTVFVDDKLNVYFKDIEATRQYILTETKGVAGAAKTGFAPPEQYAGIDGHGMWTDVYSMAATYYYMVSGKRPVAATDRSHDDTLKPLSTVFPKFPEKISKVIASAMSVMYWERPQNVDIFMDEFDKAEGVTLPSPYIKLLHDGKIRQWKVEADRDIHIGRSPEDSEITVDGASISRLHCTVHYNSKKNTFTVTDLSSNGTFSQKGLIGRGNTEDFVGGGNVFLVSNQYELSMEVR